ncbi:MAG: MFS transporter, partial [Gemmatimonadota bacterium]
MENGATATPPRGGGWLDRLGLGRRELWSWALYDWANSAFATTIIAAVLPIYYVEVAAADMAGNVATAYWGYTNTAAIVLIALAAPVLGAVADHLGAKKRFLAAFVVLGVTGTAGLFLVARGDWLLASALFVVGNVGFAGSIVFSDALLPHIARSDELDRVSAAGWALGYFGGGLLLALNAVMLARPELFG